MGPGVDESIAAAAARMRAMLGEHARGERTLAALLGDLKHVIHELPEGSGPRLREVTSALRAVGRAWSSGGASPAGSLSFDGEAELRAALADLRRTVERLV